MLWCVSGIQGGERGLRDNGEEYDKDAALAFSVRHVSARNADDAGENVRRDRHELCAGVGVSEALDDRGQKGGDGVERDEDADVDEHLDVNLPVLERVLEVLEVELVGETAAVVLEAAEHLDALVLGEELGRVRVVVHDPVGGDGDDGRDGALDYKDPAPAAEAARAVELNDAARQKPAKRAGRRGRREEDGHAQPALVASVPERDATRTPLACAPCHGTQ